MGVIPLYLNVLDMPMWVWVYSRGPPFSLSDSTFQRMAGTLADGCLAVYFPGSKVGQMYYFYSFFLTGGLFSLSLIVNCYIAPSTITPLLCGWFQRFSFYWLGQGSLKSSLVERLQIRPCFVPHYFFSGSNPSNFEKYFNFKHLQHN